MRNCLFSPVIGEKSTPWWELSMITDSHQWTGHSHQERWQLKFSPWECIRLTIHWWESVRLTVNWWEWVWCILIVTILILTALGENIQSQRWESLIVPDSHQEVHFSPITGENTKFLTDIGENNKIFSAIVRMCHFLAPVSQSFPIVCLKLFWSPALVTSCVSMERQH